MTIWDETQQRTLTLLTDIMRFATDTIAAILLLKALTQHFRPISHFTLHISHFDLQP